MATKGERQALLFLTGVVGLGAGVRLVRSQRPAPETAALDRQIAAVESVGAHSMPRSRSRTAGHAHRAAQAAPPASVQPGAAAQPSPRLDIDAASEAQIERL